MLGCVMVMELELRDFGIEDLVISRRCGYWFALIDPGDHIGCVVLFCVGLGSTSKRNCHNAHGREVR